MKRAVHPSMKHVAAAAGVSTMTVSLALRHDPSITADTRRRVLEAAQRLGYRRNPLVAALMAGLRGWHPRGRDTHVLAYVEQSANFDSQQQASMARFRAGAEEGALRHGYRLEVFRLGVDDLTEVRLEQVLTARGIRGVVFAPMPRVGSRLTQAWEHQALAALGYSIAHPPLHRAVNHQVHSFRLAIAELFQLGYRHIGVAMSRHEDARVERNWLSSFLLLQHEHAGTDCRLSLLFPEKLESGRLRSWLRDVRPDAIVSTEPGVAALLRASIHPHGAALGFAHLHLTSDLAGYSGIDQNNERVGAAAVDLVVEQLHANNYGIPANPKTVLIEGRWVPGKSTRPPATAQPAAPRLRSATARNPA